ncbi:MAG: 6-carboxytetrahydropterin synthase [Thermoprotei archaeon]|nr:MAG: 6-carboxytetrahydropterin synthase [Thermoprotei archaeon]
MKAIIGIKDLDFDAAHYTGGIESKCKNLHGHTFRVEVEVYGEIEPKSGMVIDFLLLKRIVKDILSDYDHKIIVPKKDLDKIRIEGPFNIEFKAIEYPEATTEYIALDIARRIYDKIGTPVIVKLYEGLRNYVVVKWGFKNERDS